ncbi:MAG: hypothetical protein ACM3XS_10310, partial [Bacteroidota bacterium]
MIFSLRPRTGHVFNLSIPPFFPARNAGYHGSEICLSKEGRCMGVEISYRALSLATFPDFERLFAPV